MIRLLAVGVAVAGLHIAPASADVWSDSYDPATKTRFIPVELWTGSKWDGQRTINQPQANLRFNGNKTIRGLYDWKDPLTGQMRKVYQRDSPRGKNAIVTQIFAVREDGSGIGRLWDSRRKEFERGESKFPLGEWKQDETRTYTIETFDPQTKGQINIPTTVRITIEQIDHRFEGNEHCMTFRWQKMRGQKMTDNNAYTYCPGKGLASLDDD
jgi:hypothetical protein